MKTAVLFSGQGTQYVGMGKHLYDNHTVCKRVFEEADSILGESLSTLIFDGPTEALNLTRNTQPAVLTVGLAAWALMKQYGAEPAVVAGHSVGEFAALVAAGAMSFENALPLVRQRGEFMQTAVPAGEGGMIVVQRMPKDRLKALCESVSGYCALSVHNAPNLFVVSGETASITELIEKLKLERAVVIPLAVSAPFHCKMLTPAARALEDTLARIEMSSLETPYVANVDATWYDERTPQELRTSLAEQVVAPVRWSETLELMLSKGIERFWHMGPGRSTLTHVKKHHRKAHVATWDDPDAVTKLLSEMGESRI